MMIFIYIYLIGWFLLSCFASVMIAKEDNKNVSFGSFIESMMIGFLWPLFIYIIVQELFKSK